MPLHIQRKKRIEEPVLKRCEPIFSCPSPPSASTQINHPIRIVFPGQPAMLWEKKTGLDDDLMRLFPLEFGDDLGCCLSVSLHGIFHRVLIKVTGSPQIGLIDHLPVLLVNELVVGGEGVGGGPFPSGDKTAHDAPPRRAFGVLLDFPFYDKDFLSGRYPFRSLPLRPFQRV